MAINAVDPGDHNNLLKCTSGYDKEYLDGLLFSNPLFVVGFPRHVVDTNSVAGLLNPGTWSPERHKGETSSTTVPNRTFLGRLVIIYSQLLFFKRTRCKIQNDIFIIITLAAAGFILTSLWNVRIPLGKVGISPS